MHIIRAVYPRLTTSLTVEIVVITESGMERRVKVTRLVPALPYQVQASSQ